MSIASAAPAGNGTSWMLATAEARGFSGPTEFARAAGVGDETAWYWWHGTRPEWRFLQPIADALGLTFEEVTSGLLGHRSGDVCPCPNDCRGVLEAPASPHARRFATRRVCPVEGCESVTLYDHNRAWTTHTRLCRAHSLPRGQQVERTVFTCVGYSDAERIRHAAGCPRTKGYSPGQLRKLLDHQDENASAERQRGRWGEGSASFAPDEDELEEWFVDPDTLTMRCNPCATGSRAFAVSRLKIAARLKTDVASFDEIAATPGAGVAMFTGRRPDPDKLRSRLGVATSPEHAAKIAAANIVRRWSTPISELPMVIVAHCAWQGCSSSQLGELQLLDRSKLFHRLDRETYEGIEVEGNLYRDAIRGVRHRECMLTEQGERLAANGGRLGALDKKQRQRGRECGDHRRDFAWAIQKYIGGRSYREIAADYGVKAPTVHEKVEHIIQHLPDESRVSAGFRRHVRLLREAAQQG